eukprot:2030511-Amphidinium_carterae.1
MAAALEERVLRVYTESHTFTFTPRVAPSRPMARVRVVNGHATPITGGAEKTRLRFATEPET